MTTPSERARAIEAAFRTHPAVRDVRAVMVAGTTGTPQFSVWVVAHDAALAASSSSDEARVRKWGKVFDLMHGASKAGAEPAAPPRPAWTSTFTRQPFPPDEVDEWVDATVQLVRSLSPSRVLELGCGSGVLVSRLAAGCAQYVGTDLSARSLESLARYLSAVRPPLDQVTLIERPADDLEGFADGAFDTVLVNSVVQYFPHVEYLGRMLAGATRVVRPGGTILLGDVRDLTTLEPFCTALELHRAPDMMDTGALPERVARRLATLDELVLAPAWFLDVARRLPGISRVELRPKRGRFVNEFTAHRYELLLHVGPPAPTATLEWLEWTPEWTLEAISQRLASAPGERLALRGLLNARVERDLLASRLIRDHGTSTVTVSSLRARLAAHVDEGLSPEDLHHLAARHGLRVQQSVARGEGRLDVVFDRSGEPVEWPAPPSQPGFNEPSVNVRRQSLVGALLTHVQPLLDPSAQPAAITVAQQLPEPARLGGTVS